MRLSSFIIIALMLLAAVAFVVPVSADSPPAFPHAFSGDVLINGASAPDGTSVSATVSEGDIVTDEQNPVKTVGGSYGKGDNLFLLVQGDIPVGATISFYVNGIKASNTASYTPGNVDSMNLSVTYTPTPVPTVVPGPSGGGGGGGGGYSGGFGPTVPSYESVGSAELITDSLGQVEGNFEIISADGGAQLLLSNGVQALDSNGRALSEVSITQSSAGATPGTGGALYKFGDFVYDCLPAGATFAPSIDIKFELTEAQFNALNPGQTFSVRYYDAGSQSWVEVPTYVNPNTREVIGEVEHFTYYALMAVGGTSAPVVPGAEVVPTEQPTGAVTPSGEETPATGEGMPGWIWIVLIVVIIAVAGAVFYLYKEGKIGGSNS